MTRCFWGCLWSFLAGQASSTLLAQQSHGSGIRVQGLGFRVQGLGFWVQSLGFRV